MKVMLFYPPVGNICQPYLSTPTLVAYLQEKGVEDVSQYDLNIDCAEELLSPERLRRAHRWCTHFLQKSQGAWSSSPLDQAKVQFAIGAALNGPKVIHEITRAKSILRGQEFYDEALYSDAMQTILLAYVVLSARYFPTIVSHQSFSMRYRCDRSGEILSAIHDQQENPFIDLLARKLEDIFREDGVPDVAGISIGYYEQLIPGLTLASLIKRVSPRTHVTVGGTMMSALHGKNFDPRFFSILDSILFFEGEKPFLGLLKALENGGDVGQVPNLIVSRNGKVITTPVEPAAAEADSLPTPDFDGLPIDRYLSPEPILPLASSRGCYWRQCTFCTRQHLLDTYRKRSVHKVLQDLQTLQSRYGCQAFFFVDECISPAMLGALADEILEKKIHISWSCYVRFEKQFMDKGFCRKLAQSGLRMLYFGLESACQRILDLMKKGTEKETVQRILESTSQAGIMSMILYFVGFPTETREEALESMEFILRNQDHIRYALAGQFMLEEHSPIFRHPESFGIREITPLSDTSDLGIIYNYQTVNGMSAHEAETVKEFVNSKTSHLHKFEFLNRAHLLLRER